MLWDWSWCACPNRRGSSSGPLRARSRRHHGRAVPGVRGCGGKLMTDENARLAWVTGAANGIGAAIAARLLNDGLRVLAIDQDEEGLSSLSRSHPGLGLETQTFDLSDTGATPQALEDLVAQHGTPTRLALNAGVWPGEAIVDMSDDIWISTSPSRHVSVFLPPRPGSGHGQSRRWRRRVHGESQCAPVEHGQCCLRCFQSGAAGTHAHGGRRVRPTRNPRQCRVARCRVDVVHLLHRRAALSRRLGLVRQ